MKKTFKKYINKFGLMMTTTALLLTSCYKDVDVWDSATLEYSGTFFFELFDSKMENKIASYDHDIQLLIYNTNENIKNNIWIDDTHEEIPLKSKFTLSGDASMFQSSTSVFADLEDNTLGEIGIPTTAPTAADEETTAAVTNIKSVILEGKILPKAGTTTSGNPVDSIYIKINMLSGNATYRSAEVPVADRTDPLVAEFEWVYQGVTQDETLNDTIVISGHRKTGFPEDDH